MANEDDSDMGFQHRSRDSLQNCPSSGFSNTTLEMGMSSGALFKYSNTGDPFFGSGWSPLVQMGRSANFGASSLGAQSEYVIGLGNQAMAGASHLAHYHPSGPKLPCLGSENFSDMVGSFGLPGSSLMGPTEMPSTTAAHSQGDQQVSSGAMGDSPLGKRKRKASEPNSLFNAIKNGKEQKKDVSIDNSENPKEPDDDKGNKNEQNVSANLRGKQQVGKQNEDNSKNGEAPKEAYIHVRARRGQATNSHSLAERVRRERISERMRLLQELVPGCNKITGKAVMLDEIINYVQSLQQQVEFLSMKLATVNPELNVDLERILSKEILHTPGGSVPIPGFGPSLSSHHSYPPGNLAGAPSSIPFHPMPQNVWDSDLHTLLQLRFDSNQAINNPGHNGCSKLDL